MFLAISQGISIDVLGTNPAYLVVVIFEVVVIHLYFFKDSFVCSHLTLVSI